jgi:hypothetical protein
MFALECDSLTEALGIQPSELGPFMWRRATRPPPRQLRSAFQDDLRDGVLCGVGKRKRYMHGAQPARKLGSLAVESDCGTPSGLAADFNIAPGDPMIPAGAEGLHGRFFRGEAGRVPLDPVSFRVAVADLGLGENPAQEAIFEALDGCFYAPYFCYVDAGADNHADSVVVGSSKENTNVS